MTLKILLSMLAALELQLRACADAIRVLREAANEPSPEPQGVCPHPPAARQKAGAMGHPSRFLCRQCGKLMEIINGEVTEVAG